MISSNAVRRRRLAGAAVAASILASGLVTGVARGSEPSPAATAAAHEAVRLGRSSPIVVSAPSSVQVGSTIRLVGDVAVAAKKPRPVKLAEKQGNRWKVIARTSSTRTGSFTFRVPAGKAAGTRVFRAQADPAHGLGAVRTGGVKVKVTAKGGGSDGPTIPGTSSYDAAEGLPKGYDAAGARSDWSYLFGADSVRWDPCTVIRWRYNDNGQAYSARADVTRAIAKISGVSGLKFKYVGSTAFRYVGQSNPHFPANADLFVSWANQSDYSALSGSTVGVGGGNATSAGAGALHVDWRMIDGYLTLDKGAPQLAHGFDGSGWGQIMMHETLHAMGLGHARTSENSRQLMAPSATSLNYRFGAGDITGMHTVGERANDDCGW